MTGEERFLKLLTKVGIPAGVILASFAVTVIILFAGSIIGFDSNSLNIVLMDAAFFTVLGTIGFIVLGLIGTSFSPVYGGENKDINISNKILLYSVGKILALGTFIYVNLWILIVSPFSFFGGSVYGGFMQVIIAVPLVFLLLNFWANGSTPGLFMIAVACAALFPLSFTFPTLFTNLYVLTTGSSAAAGGAAMSNFAVVDPMSYYRSSILQAGTTEPVVGPTYEEVTDNVIGVEVEISGRMCDDSDLVATVSLDNEAKYKLSDVFVQLSAVRDVYANVFGDLFDICSIEFESNTGEFQRFYTEAIADIPKGAPATVSKTFTTHLPADVLTQFCNMRTDIVLSYHTTSVFPLTMVEYNSYLVNPVNIGNPTSTSSFGKVRVDMDVGQQPIPVDDNSFADCVSECESEDLCTQSCAGNEFCISMCESSRDACVKSCKERVLLKVGWSKKGDGIVNNPEIYLFLPGDLGICEDYSLTNYGENIGGGLFQYSGSITQSIVKGESRFEYPDFCCFDYDKYVNGDYDNEYYQGSNVPCYYLLEKVEEEEKTVDNFCARFFSSSITPEGLNQDPNKATSGFNIDDILDIEKSLSVPGTSNVCQDLVEKGYSVCRARFNPSTSDVLFCTLQLDPDKVDVTEVDMNTYLIRADAIYEFHDVTTTLFEVENCDAI